MSFTKVTLFRIVPFTKALMQVDSSPEPIPSVHAWTPETSDSLQSPPLPCTLCVVLYYSFILYSASKDVFCFGAFFNMLCLMRAYIPVCMLQRVLCNANHSFDFIAILGKNFLINESFYPCEQKVKRYHINPMSCGDGQRNQQCCLCV